MYTFDDLINTKRCIMFENCECIYCKRFLKDLEDLYPQISWWKDKKPTNHPIMPHDYNGELCIVIGYSMNNILSYSPYSFFKQEGYTAISPFEFYGE